MALVADVYLHVRCQRGGYPQEALGERLVLIRSVKTNKALLLTEVTRPGLV